MSGGCVAETNKAVEVLNSQGKSPVLFLCEHASNHIPNTLDGLGLSADMRESHIAWDPGARSVALHLAQALDAPMVASAVSRLVYDCNRPPGANSAIPSRSETTDVPGNFGLTDADRDHRVALAYRPFCKAVTDRIMAAKPPKALVTIHSFTPVYFGKPRAVEIGILHDDDDRLANAMLAEAGRLPHRQVDRNEPYGPQDGVTHSLKIHGQAHGLAPVMIEIRNDLLQTPEAERAIAGEVLSLLVPALETLSLLPEGAPRA